MAPLGPFERSPCVAVAVSGGADSLALSLLADRWARAAGGAVVALTVDHGMRAEARDEARRVTAWLAGRGIRHHVLRRPGPPPAHQAAARALRYGLLTGWCRRHGVLHLMLAHHLDDQGETLLLRLERGSGDEGLAAMAALTHRADVRLLRPLLTVPKARLVALLRQAGQEWIEDPSNRDRAYARVRLRDALPALADKGFDAAHLAGRAREMGRARAARDADISRLVARAVEINPAGFARLDAKALTQAPREVALRTLSRLLRTIGGGAYGPRAAALERLLSAFGDGSLVRGRTLAGCRVMPARGRVLICREPAAARERLALDEHVKNSVLWDGRFRLRLDVKAAGAYVSRLGREGWVELAAAAPAVRDIALPAAAWTSLPALRDATGLVAVPHARFQRRDACVTVLGVEFRPQAPVLGARFTVA